MKHGYELPFGAQVLRGGETRFRLWAPSAQRVVLKAQSPQGGHLQADLSGQSDGWYEQSVAGLDAGTRYCFRIDDEIDVPDPASRSNPDGPHRPSEIVDPHAFEWQDQSWRGRPWHEAVIYELHVGAFTPEGSFAAVAARLDELVQLGITALELMPLATFAGRRGWGYDGVLPYAPHPAYGRPDDLKRLVQAAHERGLMVLLDVVYNHFGPEGNYLARYAREFFNVGERTPWGDGIDFSRAPVREFFIHNALYWLEEYRFDGLRVDAIHAIHTVRDPTPVHLIDELIERVRHGPGRERYVHVVLENERNEASRLRRRPGQAVGQGLAQWNDDFHHSLHVILSGESDGYYRDFAERPFEHLGRVLAQGFAYQGEHSQFSGRSRGEPSADLPPDAFVAFLQNHDQIGNRAFGERLSQLTGPQQLRAALAMLLLAPHVPMLFMGEEYAASQPFLYFCDYQGELAAAISAGRRDEFAAFLAFADIRAPMRIPDPNLPESLERSRLVWSERLRPPHEAILSYVRQLLETRARRIVPLIPQLVAGQAAFEVRQPCLAVRWLTRSGAQLQLHANLGAAGAECVGDAAGEVLHSTSGTGEVSRALQAWEVRMLLKS